MGREYCADCDAPEGMWADCPLANCKMPRVEWVGAEMNNYEENIRCEESFLLTDIDFPAVVIFPRKMSREDYRDFCDHLELVKRKVKRWNEIEETDDE